MVARVNEDAIEWPKLIVTVFGNPDVTMLAIREVGNLLFINCH
jgi:hypothetical protein